VKLLGVRLVREGVLQQSALSAADAACGPVRAAALVSAVLDIIDACDDVVASGAPAASVEELDFTPFLRAREAAGGESEAAVAAVTAARDAVLAQVEGLR
jgi:V/A-type H+-transporting ATPase subunit A